MSEFDVPVFSIAWLVFLAASVIFGLMVLFRVF